MKRGDKVACIDANGTAPKMDIKPELIEGEVYTIAWIGDHVSYLDGTYRGVRLAEVRRGVCPWSLEQDIPFRASRFKPLVEGKATKQKVLVHDDH